MDPYLCCLLGICCPPLERREKAIAYYQGKGADAALAEILADDLIAHVDAFLETPLGVMVKAFVAHTHAHKSA